MPWTKERLESLARERLAGAKLMVVANRADERGVLVLSRLKQTADEAE